jgi:putative ABC transport system permease protein
VIVDGKSASANTEQFVPGYFEADGMPLRAGRLPTLADIHAATPVAVVNETAAARLFADGRAVGRQISVSKVTFEVVGMVRDVRHGGPQAAPRPEIFVAYGQRFPRALTVVVRPRGGRAAAIEQMRAAVAGVGIRALVHEVRGGEEWLGDRVRTPRRRTMLLGLLGGLGWLLTLVGIFGVTAYSVARRTQEIGVRVAFGATPGNVVRTMVRDVLLPLALGVAAGLAGAAASTRVIASFLFETTPVDAPTFAAVAVCLAAAAIVAAWIPARRAALVDPIAALRAE